MTTASPTWRDLERILGRFVPKARLLRAWRPEGGVSAQVTGLEFALPDGERRTCILRRHGERDRSANPQVAENEFRLLEILRAAGIPAPVPLYLDASCTLLEAPYILIEHVPGVVVTAPADLPGSLEQIAATLARIHRLDAATWDLAFLPSLYVDFGGPPAQDDPLLDLGHIRAVLLRNWLSLEPNPPVLLHGDYWPGNLLWQDGRLRAVIDWEDAVTGDPLADLANSRLELLWASGEDAMGAFTRRYQAEMPRLNFANLPYWDLWAVWKVAGRISGWGLTSQREDHLRALLRLFASQALAALPATRDS